MADILKNFIEISVTGAVMICLIWAFRAVFAKRISPMIMMVLWLAVLLRLCVPFTIESPIHAGNIIEVPEAVSLVPRESDPMTAIDTAPVVSSGENAEVDSNEAYADTSISNAHKTEPAKVLEPTFIERIDAWLRGISLWSVLVIVWITGAAGVLLWAIYKALLFKRKVNEGCDVTDAAILETVKAYKEKLGIKRPVRVMQCSCVETPAIFGYFRPYLLLPTGFVQEVKGERLAHVLLHELCHIRRQDILMGYLWLVAKALHWFNPFVWGAYRLYRDDVELCCDRMVIRHLNDGDPYAYSQTLIDVVRSSKCNTVTAAMSLCENKQKLKERVIRMLNPKKRSRFAVAVSLLLGLTILIGCFTTACQPKTGDILNIDPSDEIIYSDEYVAGQDSQYWYTNQCFDYTPMADTVDAYYFMAGPNNCFLYRMDKLTGEMAPVCNKKGCNHGDDYDPSQDYMDSECNAFFGPFNVKALMYYRGKLYCLNYERKYGEKFYEISLTGGAPTELRTLTKSRYVRSIAIHRGYVYYIDSSSSSEGTTPQITTNKVFRFPIDDPDAEAEIVYTVEGVLPGAELLCYGNYVYINESYATDKDRNYSVRQLFRYNITTGEIETIVDDGVGARFTIFNGRLAYFEMNGTYLCDLDGGNKERISDHYGALSVSGDYLLIDNSLQMLFYRNMDRTIYAYDTDGKYVGSAEIADWDCHDSPVGAVDGLYFAPTFDSETQTHTMYSMPIDKIVDGTAVPEVFYQGEPTSLDITVSP